MKTRVVFSRLRVETFSSLLLLLFLSCESCEEETHTNSLRNRASQEKNEKKIDTKTAANSAARARASTSLYDSINALLFFYIKSARENIDYYDDDDDDNTR